MSITNQNTKRIYKKAMAEFLIDNGCELVKTVPDLIYKKRLNWIFVDNDLLQQTMAKFPRKQEV